MAAATETTDVTGKERTGVRNAEKTDGRIDAKTAERTDAKSAEKSELPKSGTLNGKYNFNKLQKVLELHTFLLAKHSKMCYNF